MFKTSDEYFDWQGEDSRQSAFSSRRHRPLVWAVLMAPGEYGIRHPTIGNQRGDYRQTWNRCNCPAQVAERNGRSNSWLAHPVSVVRRAQQVQTLKVEEGHR